MSRDGFAFGVTIIMKSFSSCAGLIPLPWGHNWGDIQSNCSWKIMLKYWRSSQRLGAKKINLSDNWQNSTRNLVWALSVLSPHIILEVRMEQRYWLRWRKQLPPNKLSPKPFRCHHPSTTCINWACVKKKRNSNTTTTE